MKQTVFLILIILFFRTASPAQSIATLPISTTICAGSSVSVIYSTTGSFLSGNVFTAQLSNGSGSFANPIDIGTFTDTTSGGISATIPAGSITDTGYRIRVISSSPPITGSDNGSNITINSDTPLITIGASLTTLCPGNSVTLRATEVNGGPTPVYQWEKNGVDVGNDSAYYTDTVLNNDDAIVCVLTSDAMCPTTTTVFSNIITLTSSQVDTPAITVIATQRDTICIGNSITFIAVPIYGGSSPSFQWKVNGLNVGTDSAGYTAILANNDIVSCVLTSNAACIAQSTATSNNITVTVNPLDTPTISITANHTTICSGTSVTFTATGTGGGVSPFYQWVVNNSNAGGDSATFTSTSLTNNDVVSCWYTSSAACSNPHTAFGNNITMTVNTTDTPRVSITATQNTICSGVADTLNATITYGGSSPVYQWKVNGSNVGTNSPAYISSSLNNNAVVSCIVISNAVCASPPVATSNDITMTVIPSVTPVVNITATETNICTSNSSIFSATATNGGSSPFYQWLRNGIAVGVDAATYTDNNLSNGEVVICVLTSNATCAVPDTAISNTIAITDSNVTPAVSITASQTTLCRGNSITFTAIPVYGGATPSYQWKKNGANVGTDSAVYTDTNISNGEIVSCLLTSNAHCLTTDTARSNSITIADSAITPVILIGATETSICPGTEIIFTAYPSNGGNSPSYQWTVNGISVGGDTTYFASDSLANNDVVICKLTSSLTCITSDTVNSNTLNITVHAPVTPAISISTPSGAVCAGTSVSFTSTISNGGSSPVYIWERNGNSNGDNTNAYTTTSLDSADTITCLLISNALCASRDTAYSNAISVQINPTPNAAITPSGTFSICQGDSISFSASAGGTGYLWSNTATTQSITVTTGGGYVVTVTSSNNCQGVSDSVLVTVLPLPVPVITQSVYTLISTPATTYQWYLNDTLLVNDTGQDFQVIQNGQYQVEVTDSSGCKNISAIYTVYSVGITEIVEAAGVKVYPNPNSGSFTVEFGDDAAKEIEITDITGQIILSRTEATRQYQVNMPEGASGLYFLRVIQNNKPETFKLLVTQ